MKREKFEKIVTDAGYAPLGKYPTPWGAVLLAGRYGTWTPEMPMPHIAIMWAVERGELDIGQPIYFKPDKRRIHAYMEHTAQVAGAWIQANISQGRYDA